MAEYTVFTDVAVLSQRFKNSVLVDWQFRLVKNFGPFGFKDTVFNVIEIPLYIQCDSGAGFTGISKFLYPLKHFFGKLNIAFPIQIGPVGNYTIVKSFTFNIFLIFFGDGKRVKTVKISIKM